MLAIRDLNGEVYLLTGASEIIRKRRVNGEKELSLKLHKTKQNAHFFDDIEKLWRIIDFSGEEYPIMLYRDVAEGNGYLREFSCLHGFFDRMRNHVIYETFSGSKTIDDMMRFIFTGSGYAYNISGSFYTQDFENFGDDYGLELFKTALERYQAEFFVDGYMVQLRTEIGNVTDFQYRHKFNLESLEREVDALDFSTYGEGFGKDGLHVVYRSPLADIYGERPIKAIRDERFTIGENLLEKVKDAVDSSLKITLTVKLTDLRASGYNKNHPDEGDTVILVDDRLNLKVDVRIVEIVEKLDKKGKVVDCDVTLSNFSNIFEQQRRIHNATKTLSDALAGKRPLPFEALAAAVQQATIALQNAQTELTFPVNGGIMAVDKNNPNNIVIFNSAGLGISDDGGQSFETAITGNGIVADLITVGTMLFDRIRGGMLILGGPDNGNGIMQVLDENGEIIVDLDAGNGAFEWLRIGDVISDSVVKTNLSNLTYYVDPVNGDDENDGLSYDTKKKTIQSCIDSLPKFNAGTIDIVVDNGTIKENITVTGFIGDGYIVVDLQDSQIDGNLKIMSNMNRVDFKNGVINSANETYATVYISKTTQSAMINLKLYCRNATAYGFSAVDNTFMQVIGCEVYDTNNCIRAGHGSSAYVENCKGLGEYGVVADYVGAIGGAGSAPVGTISNTRAIRGGVIRNTFTHDSGERAMPTPPAPPPAPDVTKTWSASSADNYSMNGWGWVNEGYPKQGNYGYGRRKGLWFFGSEIYNTVNGKNIKRVRVYVKRKSSGGSSSKTTIQIRSHTYSSKPGGEPTLSNAYKSISLGWGEGAWIDMPSDFITAFKSGGARGIGIYVASDSSAYYALMEAAAKIEITYS